MQELNKYYKMDLKKIKKELEKYDFVSYIKENIIFAGKKGEPDKELGIETMINAFRVFVENEVIILEYSYGQLPIKKEYNSVEELIVEIKKNFPLY